MTERNAAEPRDVVPETNDLPAGESPGAASVPVGDDRSSSEGIGARVEPGSPPPPGSNQGKLEPVPPTPGHAEPDAVPGPAPERSDLDAGTVGSADPQAPARTAPGSPPSGVAPGQPTAGDPQGVSAPMAEPAEGTSENSEIVQGVRSVALAPPGSPDGQVDTRL